METLIRSVAAQAIAQHEITHHTASPPSREVIKNEARDNFLLALDDYIDAKLAVAVNGNLASEDYYDWLVKKDQLLMEALNAIL